MTTPIARRSLCLMLCLALAALPPAAGAQIEQSPRGIATPTAPGPASPGVTSDGPTNPPYGDGGDYGDGQRPRGDGGGKNWLIPAIIVGAAALFAIGKALAEEKAEKRDIDEGTRELLRDGPQLAPQFNASAFGVRGLVRGHVLEGAGGAELGRGQQTGQDEEQHGDRRGEADLLRGRAEGEPVGVADEDVRAARRGVGG